MAWRIDHEAAAREPFAPVVVGIAFERQRNPARHEGAKARAGGPGEVNPDRLVRQAIPAVTPRDLVAQHRADRPIDVSDRQIQLHWPLVFKGVGAQRD